MALAACKSRVEAASQDDEAVIQALQQEVATRLLLSRVLEGTRTRSSLSITESRAAEIMVNDCISATKKLDVLESELKAACASQVRTDCFYLDLRKQFTLI